MKRPSSAPIRGFTLVELLIAVSLVALLVALSWLAFQLIMNKGREKQTVTLIQGVHRAIQDYKDDHGHYPRAAHEDETTVVKEETWVVGGARMLYQVLSGDGTDAIRNGEEPSSGEQGSSAEGKDPLTGKIYMDTIIPPTRKMLEEKKEAKYVDAGVRGTFFVVDAWRHPLQYHLQIVDQSQPPDSGEPRMHSENQYEIWSYGRLKKPQESSDEQKKWITNWGRE